MENIYIYEQRIIWMEEHWHGHCTERQRDDVVPRSEIRTHEDYYILFWCHSHSHNNNNNSIIACGDGLCACVRSNDHFWGNAWDFHHWINESLWEMRTMKIQTVECLSLYIAATHDSLFAVFKSTHSKYRCDDYAVDRIYKMKWSAANESVEPAADAGAHAITAMALGQKAPHFDMHDSGHGRKFNVIRFNYTTPNANPITTSICL